MYRLLLLSAFAVLGAAGKEFKPSNARANSSAPLEALLVPRELSLRQTYCDPGYGSCDSGGCCPLNSGCCGDGCINKQNTCCYGGVCPPGSGCCGYDGYCKPTGYGCCGSQGDIYPLDGSECCSDGNHCPPGSSCVSCSDGSGICCRGSDGDYIDPTIQTGVASVTYPSSSAATTSYSTSYSDYTYTDTYTDTYTYHSYFYTTYTYYYITWIPLYTPTTSSTITTTTTLSAFATDEVEASSSFSAAVSDIQSEASFSASLYSPASLAPASTLPAESGTFVPSEAAGGGGSVSAAPSANANLIAGILGLVSVVVGMLAVML